MGRDGISDVGNLWPDLGTADLLCSDDPAALTKERNAASGNDN